MRILVVEDDRKLAAVLRQGLKEQGFGVDVAEDGAMGLQLALAREYDAVVLDVLLPRHSGFDVLRDLRKRDRPVPVLVRLTIVPPSVDFLSRSWSWVPLITWA